MGSTTVSKFFAGLIAALLLAGASAAQAQVKTNAPAAPAAPKKPAADKPAQNEAKEANDKKPAKYPFSGKLAAVDKQAMTLSIAGKEKNRVLHITSETRITKAGKPATLQEGVAGEEVAGQAIKNADGTEKAATVRFGPKPGAKEGEKAKTDKKPAAPAPAPAAPAPAAATPVKPAK